MFKGIEKEMSKLLRAAAKASNYRILSDCPYKKIDDFFVYGFLFPFYPNDVLELTVQNFVKTYESDKLFWTIFDCESNNNMRESLRVNCAFTVPPFEISEYSLEITEDTDLEEVCQRIMERIAAEHCDFINSFNNSTQMFNEYLLKRNGHYDEWLIKMIASIELHDLKKAKEMADREIARGHRGMFGVCGGKYIYEYISEYCEQHMK